MWISLVMIGVALSSELNKRCRIFKTILFMTEAFSSAISYYLEPINKIVHKLSKEKSYEQLDFLELCSDFLNEGIDFPLAWEKSVRSSKLPLKNNEKQELINFGCSLGKTEPSTQSKVLNMYNSIFAAFSKKADDEKEKYGTATTVLSFLLGSLLFILLL